MRKTFFVLIIISVFLACSSNKTRNVASSDVTETVAHVDTVHLADTFVTVIPWKDRIIIEKALKYDYYTLQDTFPYKDTVRIFQWNKIRYNLALLDSIQDDKGARWGILRNYKNRNGRAPLVRNYVTTVHNRVSDTLGVLQYQSVPLYLLTDTLVPEIYGRDGLLVKLIDTLGTFHKVAPAYIRGEWLVPDKYIKIIRDSVVFEKTMFVDRTNQNIATMEKADSTWYVRSMNPVTTGLSNPPYQYPTPTGIFVLQEKKERMVFLKDGSVETGGFAPYASRFNNGGYIHGIPVNEPRTKLIEYTPSLGTTPRSHMCVRNATSHAKFIYDWAPTEKSIIFVFD